LFPLLPTFADAAVIQESGGLIGGYSLLAGLAAVLLVFVSGGVIYLSSIEWRDRRRRNQQGGGR
jgi:hypothetical protein